MESKPPLQGKPVRRKVHVVYYLSRGGGHMDHPHLLEGYLSAAQDGLRLRDFKRWLAVLRGKSMPTSFAWSYKRTYKNGFIWHDLGDNDLIQPLSKNEYVLMGSEIKELAAGATTGKCKCGGIQQQPDTKIVAEAGDNSQEEALNKLPVMRSPKVVTKSSSYNADHQEHRNIIDANNVNSPARSGLISTTENKFHDNGIRITSRGNLYRVGGSSRSFNDLTAQRLLLEEQVKTPTNHHDTAMHLATRKSLNNMSSRGGPSLSVSVRDCESIAEENYITDGILDVVDARRKDEMGAGHDLNEDDSDGTYIMDAATQTGDSTRCSTDDHQDDTNATGTGYSNMLVEMVGSPGASAKLSAIRRVSSARFNNSDSHGLHAAQGSLSMHLSQDFSDLPDEEKSIMMNQRSDVGVGDIQNVGHVSLSNHTSLHNHMGSPGALSSCSGMSARSSTRFAREEGNPAASNNYAKKYGVKSEDHHHYHRPGHHLSKGASTQYSSSTSASTMTSSSASHTLLKQLLTCGNADVVSEKKHNQAADNVIMITNNAVSGLQTPSKATKAGAVAYIQEGDKSKKILCGACKPAGLMKRMSSAASSENRSVISATASEQGSMRDTIEMISSPESVYVGAASHRHLKRDMIRAHSLSTSSTAAALRSHAVQLSSEDHTSASGSASHKRTHHQQLTHTAGSTSPGMRSVGSSTSRRSSISKNEVNIVGGGDVEEGFHEALQSHHIGVRVSSKSRVNKGNTNTLLINDILEEKEESHGTRKFDADITNAKKGGSKTHSATTVSELHKLICNPSGTPTCGHHNKVTSTNFVVPLEQSGHNYHQAHIHSNTRDSYTPQHAKSHHILIASHGPSRTPCRSSNLNSPNIAFLSKSMNSPSSLFLETQPRTTSSSYVSSWKDLLWSPRNGSSQKEREKRHMKP